MERIDGVTMVDSIARSPWTLRRRARELADLHQQLHVIESPDFLGTAPVGHGNSLVHMDLHPLNVLIGARGPVVIDWAGAARGDPTVDVVIAWVLMSTGQVPVGRLESLPIRAGRGLQVRSLLACFDQPALPARVRDVVSWKVKDPHMSDIEVAAMWRLAERAGTSA